MVLWSQGKLLADDTFSVSVLDRTFEHGLGLFETLRTWNGHATLLDRHLTRMKNSALVLGLRLDGVILPDDRAISELNRANGTQDDVVLRLTLSGGVEGSASTLWVRTLPLPAPPPSVVRLGTRFIVSLDNPLNSHKTLNYWQRRRAYTYAVDAGCFDALAVTADGRIWETSRANLFGMHGGRLLTPGPEGPFLAGIMRQHVFAIARGLGTAHQFADIDWGKMDAVFLTNSARGIVPVTAMEDLRFPQSESLTHDLQRELVASLCSGADST